MLKKIMLCLILDVLFMYLYGLLDIVGIKISW